MNTKSTTNFFGMTYCTVSYGVRDGKLCRIIEDGITGDETIAESLPATAEHVASFAEIASVFGPRNIECFEAAERYFADNYAVRAYS